MKRLLLAMVLVFTVLLPTRILACSCDFPGTIEEHVDRTEVIFIGKTLQTQKSKGPPQRVTRFRVVEKMKGADKEVFLIFHDRDKGSNCGIDFKKGETYFIFAYLDESNRANTDMCELTRDIRSFDSETLDAYRAASSKG